MSSRALLGLFLSLSIVFSLTLLLTDAELWAVAPDHAYALIILTIIDSLVLGGVYMRNERVLRLTPFWGVFKTLLLLGDILTASRFGLTYAEFATYLFSLWSFTALFLSQLGIMASGIVYLRKVGKRGPEPVA